MMMGDMKAYSKIKHTLCRLDGFVANELYLHVLFSSPYFLLCDGGVHMRLTNDDENILRE